jgi:hypothetical protein
MDSSYFVKIITKSYVVDECDCFGIDEVFAFIKCPLRLQNRLKIHLFDFAISDEKVGKIEVLPESSIIIERLKTNAQFYNPIS